MTKTLVAYTAEIDDPETAIGEIKSQLKPDTQLMNNSVGIIGCHYEFVESEMVKEICDALPFDVLGIISTTQSINDKADTLILTIIVITSDDVEFVTTLTPSLSSDPGNKIAETYKKAAGSRAQKPALILAFAPFMIQNSGDEYVSVLSEVSDNVPCFGTLAVDDTEDFSKTFMIMNGDSYSDKMSMILVYGNLSPKFYLANISPDRILEKSAIVTKSAGHVIMEVNSGSVDVFFEDLGLTKASETQYAMSSLPLMIDYNDGTPQVSKIFVALTPERYALCAGAIPEGSTLQIAISDKDDVLLTTRQAVEQMLADIKGASGLLIFSCVSRSMTLGMEQFDEINLVNDNISSRLPFMMLSSGGEICPTTYLGGETTNRFHNNAFIACLF